MAQNQQILDRIKALEDMGLVTGYFSEVYALNDENNEFFLEIFRIFNEEVCTMLGKMDAILKDETVDYEALVKDCMKLAEGVTGLGASRIANACLDLREAANDLDNRSRAWCFLKLDKIKCEYATLKQHFVEMLQLEGAEISDEYRLHGYAAF